MILAERPHLGVAALSHPGERREHNEDSYSVTGYRLGRGSVPATLAIVADGIGGHQAGEVASQVTVDTVTEVIAASPLDMPVESLRQAIVLASEAVYREAQAKPEREGMGSTAAVALVLGTRLYTVSAGDSRVYLLHRGKLSQISVDHTWVQEALEREIISASQAQDHPNAHVLRRYVGGPRGVEPDLRLRLSSRESDSRSVSNQGYRLEGGDQIVLCSDGLTDLIADDEIREALLEQSPSGAVAGLVDLARARGGHDNITIVLLTMPGAQHEPRPIRWLPMAVGAGVLMGLILGAALLTTWWLHLWPWTLFQPAVTASAPAAASPAPAQGEGAQPALPTGTPTPLPSPSPTPGVSATPIPLPTVPP